MKKIVITVDPEGTVHGPVRMGDIEPHEVDEDMDRETADLWSSGDVQTVTVPVSGSCVVAAYEDGTVRITTYVE